MGIKIKEKFRKIKKFIKEKKLETLVAIFLGITTLLVAWAGWIGSLHGGIQDINMTRSNNLAAEGNAEYNVAAQVYISDLFTWNTISSLELDKDIAKEQGNWDEVEIIDAKIGKIKKTGCTPKLQEALNKMGSQKDVSPFEDEQFVNSYFEKAKGLLEESQAVLEEGKRDNLHGDSFRLVSVLYSLVLFLLGIVGVIKDYQTRKMLFVISVCILLLALIYMLTLPMPTGFNLASFFGGK